MLQPTSIANVFQTLVTPVVGAEANEANEAKRETPRPGAFQELLGDAGGRDAGTSPRVESTAIDSPAAATLARVLEQLMPPAATAGMTNGPEPSPAAALGGDASANLVLESGSGKIGSPGEPPISRELAGFESHGPTDAAPSRERPAARHDGPVTGRAAKSVAPEQPLETGTVPQPDVAGGESIDDGRVTYARQAVRGTIAAPASHAAGTDSPGLPNPGTGTLTTGLETGREAKPLVANGSKLAAAHESKPPFNHEARPPVTSEGMPPNAREAKPLVADVAKPVAHEARPRANHEAQPPVASEARPLVAGDTKPVAQQAKPLAVQNAKPQVDPLTGVADTAAVEAGRTAQGRVAPLPGEADALAADGRVAQGRAAIVEVAHRERERSTTKTREARPARSTDGDGGRQVEIPRPTMDWETSRAIRRLQATLDLPEARQDTGHRRATDDRPAPEPATRGDDPADATRSSRPTAATSADTGSAARAGRDRTAADASAGRVGKAAAGQTGVGETATPSAGGREVEQQAPLRDIPRVDYRSLVDAIVARARELPQNGSIAVKFALNPEELGQVQVRIESHGDRVKIRILAASRAAMEALGAGTSRLAVQMADAGFGETEIDLGYESPDADNSAQQREAAQQDQAQRERGSRSAAPEAIESRTLDSRSRSTSRLDRVA